MYSQATLSRVNGEGYSYGTSVIEKIVGGTLRGGSLEGITDRFSVGYPTRGGVWVSGCWAFKERMSVTERCPLFSGPSFRMGSWVVLSTGPGWKDI